MHRHGNHAFRLGFTWSPLTFSASFPVFWNQICSYNGSYIDSVTRTQGDGNCGCRASVLTNTQHLDSKINNLYYNFEMLYMKKLKMIMLFTPLSDRKHIINVGIKTTALLLFTRCSASQPLLLSSLRRAHHPLWNILHCKYYFRTAFTGTASWNVV